MSQSSRSLALALATVLSVLVSACAGDAGSVLSPDASRKKPTQPVDTTSSTTPSSSNPVAGLALYVDRYSNAQQTADAWRATRPADASEMDKVAAQAQAKWFGDWNSDVRAAVNTTVSNATSAGRTAVLVAYDIPQRDCGGLSGGNSTTADAYRAWIAAFAAGIGGRRAIVVLEPDALAAMDCLSTADQQTRLDLLRHAVQTLRAQGGVVYLDGGNPRWRSAATMASRLTSADVAEAAGFSLNVSNFYTTSENVSYGQQVSALVGGKHFVIDTGRNGLGATSDNQWCNPDGRALGERPTTSTGNALVDALLWVKNPGESDGACNGAPAAGTWMPEYALGLAQRASY